MAKKILVVDDEEDVLLVLEARLQSQGYEVLTESDGMSGLARARHEKPDLIILDVMLPKLDGYKVCRMLKFDDLYRHIPIILLTARVQENDRKTGSEQGADAYLTKPFDAAQLLAEIKTLLKT